MLEKVGLPQILGSAPEKSPVAEQPAEKKKCKACCACPETKRARDQCVIEKGEVNCQSLIEAHKDCMRSMGFKI